MVNKYITRSAMTGTVLDVVKDITTNQNMVGYMSVESLISGAKYQVNRYYITKVSNNAARKVVRLCQ